MDKNKSKGIWLTWHLSRRSRNLAEALDLPIYEHIFEGGVVKRHLRNAFLSLKSLVVHRPRIVYLQYSFLLLIVVILYKILLRGKVVVVCDCHTKALRRHPPGKMGQFFWRIKAWSFKFSDLSIVSNEGMVPDIEILTHRYRILPDKIPKFIENWQHKVDNNSCVYINSFAVDEPHQEVLKAASGLKNGVHLFFTGKVPIFFTTSQIIPANVHFTGFLPDDEYLKLLRNSGCVLALTNEEDCLQCGAYEALSIGTPIVLSDTLALRKYFRSAAIYVKNEAVDIRRGIERALNEKEHLIAEGLKVRDLRNRQFALKLKEINDTVLNLLGSDSFDLLENYNEQD